VAEALLAAFGIAVSPFAVIPAVLLLFTSRPAACSAGFAAGWGTGVGSVTALAVLLGDLLTLPDTPPAWATWTRIVLGGALVVYGLGKLRGRSRGSDAPAWLQSLERATAAAAFRIGLVASAPNPKVALLAIAGGFSMGSVLHGPARELVGVLAFTGIATSTALLPVLAYLAFGARTLQPLGRAKDWLTSHTDVALATVMVVIGAVLLWKGVTTL
jgi:threonine/homoserine/homoserine lactone efflux protein